LIISKLIDVGGGKCYAINSTHANESQLKNGEKLIKFLCHSLFKIWLKILNKQGF